MDSIKNDTRLIQKALLRLVVNGLYDNKNSYLEDLSEEQWAYIYKLAKEHAIYGIVYDGIASIDKSIFPPKGLMFKWVIEIDQLERLNKSHSALIDKLKKFYIKDNTLPFQILKGQGIASFYKNPLHRVCGDIDLWFGNKHNTQIANNLVKDNNIDITVGDYFDSSYWLDGIDIENHSRLIELHNPLLKKTIRRIEEETFKAGTLYPAQIGSLLLQITHILKHVLNEGIGLRQICDLAVCLSKMEYDKILFTKYCKDLGIYKWTQLVFALLVKYLSLNKDNLPFPAKGNPEWLMKEIWISGNFGQSDKRWGEIPQNIILRKLYTLKILTYKKSKLITYVPGECFWGFIMLLKTRLKEIINNNSGKI